MLGNRNKAAIKGAVYKATDHKASPSKEKHVRVIILRTFSKDRDNSVEQIIRYLSIRLEKTNWAVVLKTLMIFHRCFRDGDASFMESMKTRSNHMFALQRFSSTAPATHLYTVFVKKYAKYLEEKVSVLRLLAFQFEKNKDAAKNLKAPKCFKIVPKLQSQLNALLNCKMRTQHVGQNQLIHRTYILIMKDSLTLYTMLQDSILQLLDMFWKMKKKDAQKVVSIYKLFVKETDALIGLYEIGKRFVRQLPEIKKVDTSIIESMEKHVEDLPDDDSSEEASSEKSGGKKKGVKKGKKKKSEESSEAQLKEGEDEEYDDYDDKHRKYDDDSDEQDEEQSSSEEEEQEEDLLKDFFQPSYPGVQMATPFAPTFGPGAAVMMPHAQEPSYSDKANFIKQISVVAETTNPYTPNPFAQPSSSGNPFGVHANPVTTNPFANPAAHTQNPFGGATSNPFALTNNAFNPTGSTGHASNVYASGSTPFGSAAPTSSGGYANPTNAYGSTGNPNIFGTSPFNTGGNNLGNPLGGNPLGGNTFGGNAFGGNTFGVNPATAYGSNNYVGTPITSANHKPGMHGDYNATASGLGGGMTFSGGVHGHDQNPFASGNATVTNPFL